MEQKLCKRLSRALGCRLSQSLASYAPGFNRQIWTTLFTGILIFLCMKMIMVSGLYATLEAAAAHS
jgi:hypothetical protein